MASTKSSVAVEAGQAGVAVAAEVEDPIHSLDELIKVFPPAYAKHHIEVLQHLPTVKFIEESMVALHEATGSPWWAVIAACTLGMRVIALPFQALLQRNTNQLEKLQPQVREIDLAMRREGETAKGVEHARSLKKLFADHGVHPFSPVSTMVVPLLFPPLFLSFFGAVHNLSLAHAGMATGGALWFTNLMVADSSFVLPVLSGLTWLGVMEMGGSQLYITTGSLRNATRMLSLAWIPICSTMPSGVFMFWITSNIIEIIRIALFRKDAVRDLVGIPRLSELQRIRDAY